MRRVRRFATLAIPTKREGRDVRPSRASAPVEKRARTFAKLWRCREPWPCEGIKVDGEMEHHYDCSYWWYGEGLTRAPF